MEIHVYYLNIRTYVHVCRYVRTPSIMYNHTLLHADTIS